MKIDRWTVCASRRARLLGVMALATFGSACGNLTAGGFGEVTVAVSGDFAEPSPASRAGPQMAVLDAPARSDHEVEGEVEVEMLLFLVSETQGAVPLGGEPVRVRVDVRGRGELDAVDRALVPAARYDELQIIFTDIEAEVQGLVINGVPVERVEVEIEDVSLPVSRAIDLQVDEGGMVDLLVDLNALAWLQAVDPVLGTVDESVFAALVSVVVR